MGLFDIDAAKNSARFSALVSGVAQTWNSVQGNAYSHQVAFNQSVADSFLSVADHVFAHAFPERPSAFKRLGTFVVLFQSLSPILFSHSKGGPFEMEADCEWTPRFGLTAMQVFASNTGVVLSHGGEQLHGFSFPSSHYQLEFLSVLRNYRYETLLNNPSEPEIGTLAERAFNASLILEACFYIHCDTERASQGRIRGRVEGCLEGLTALHREDIMFNDEQYLELATDMGVR